MNTDTTKKFFETKDTNGNDYLCPVGDERGGSGAGIPGDECFEKDVFERYAGNIDVAGKNG